MKKIILSTIVFAILTNFISCSNDDIDTEKPTVRILTPENESEFVQDDNITISLVLNDNEALKSFKIDIHEADGHTHGRRSLEYEVFTYELIQNIDGSPKTFNKTILVTIPANAELTEYHLGVFAIDAAGNEQEAFINFHIK